MSKYIYNSVLFIITGILLEAFWAGCIQAQDLSYSGNVQYATGSYFFEDRTESFSISNGLTLSGGKLKVNFSVPFVIQNSPWVSYNAIGYIPTGGPENRTVRDSTGMGNGHGKGDGKGMNKISNYPFARQNSKRQEILLPDTSSYRQSSFGDPNIYANLNIYSSPSGTSSIQLNSSIKLPLANPSSGFGTGEWDYGLGLSASQRIGKLFVIIDLMKWWFGNLPDLVLENPLAYGAGVGWSINSKWIINTSFNGYTEIINNIDPPMAVGFGIGHFFSQKISINGSTFVGLSESSSDFSVGVGWTVKL